ncbi:trafficking particle complex subunit 8 isoform X4, putative [Babesia ovis]|uniref:Trafficking particle complex subunit 8 isoform X4, putative n=1 Tax=Babesia ovis TaxID=5869 RepID=A0A9W5WUI8_BABOV|nr:trafficking particle complex subunit 8 isoform X4, putative [Babesia ovis]
MGIHVCSHIDLFERLAKHYSGVCMLVKATATARKKIEDAGYKSCTKLINKAISENGDANIAVNLEFVEAQELHDLEERDFDTSLLNSIANNTPEFDNGEIDFQGYPLWFSEWAVTLAKIVRYTRHKTLDIPVDATGVMLFCTPVDDTDTVVKILRETESTKVRSIVVIGEDKAEPFIESFKTTYSELILCHVLNNECESLNNDGTEDNFLSFLAKLGELFVSNTKLVLTQNSKREIPHISSKTVRSKPSDADILDLKNLLMGMDEEMQAETPIGYIDDICRGTEHEIQGVAYVYSAISQVRDVNRGVHTPRKDKGDGNMEEPKPSKEKAIADLERAITIFLKHDAKLDALLASIIMATIGSDLEARKMGSISATMELKTKADFARAALSLELCTFFTNKQRKRNFNLVMAGHLYTQAGLLNLTKRCYMLAVPLYKSKGWSLASDFLYGTLSRYNPLYCIDALNGLADQCEMLYCHSHVKNDDDNSLKSPWYVGDREMTHLRRLMKLSVLDPETRAAKGETSTTISAASGYYPALVCDHIDVPTLNGEVPHLVRIPFVFLRNKEGVPGRNCELLSTYKLCTGGKGNEMMLYNTVDDYELQEAAMSRNVKRMAEHDALWKRCHDFICDYGNISYKVDPDSGYCLPKQTTKHSINYPLDEPSVIRLELVNPLHIGIHCDEFHVLIKGVDTSWWEAASVVTPGDGTYQSKPKENFVYLSEGERRCVYLKFNVMRPGTFNVSGLAWKLFGCVTCWVPLYVCGPRKTKGAPINFDIIQSLNAYVGTRESNKGLSMSIRDTHPEISIALSKVTQLPSNATPLDQNSEYFQQVKHYMGVSELHDPCQFEEGGNLSMDEAIAGEYVITMLSIKNTGEAPIDAVSLVVKTSGKCHVSTFPIAYISQSSNVNIVWEDMAKCNLGSISGNKAYQVTLMNDTDGLILSNDVLTIVMLLVPGGTDVQNVVCMQGRLKTSSKCYNIDGTIAFWRFYTVDDGLDITYEYDHSLGDMLKCNIVNKSKGGIKALCFYDSMGSPLKTHIENQHTSRNQGVTGLKRNSFLSVLPFNPNDSKVTLRWECGKAVGLVTSNIFVDSTARLLVKITSDVSSITYEGAPIIVHVKVILENPTEETIPPLRVEGVRSKTSGNIHSWFYVGLLTIDVPQIRPKCTACIGFDVLIPLPGVYFFMYDDINIIHSQPLSITPCDQHMISVE